VSPAADTYLEDKPGLEEIFSCQIMQRCTKGLQGVQNTWCVGGIRSNPDIKVFGGSNVAMGSQRVGINDQILNAVGVELG
jgi:hypothetical protein